jgi:hypothetical protein
MDALSILDIASTILAVISCGAALVSAVSKVTGALPLDNAGVDSALERLRARRLSLSVLHKSTEQQSSETPSQTSGAEVRALHGIALSCLEESGTLVDEVEDKLRLFHRGEARTRAIQVSWLELEKSSVFDQKRVEWLSRAVTIQVSSVIRYALRFAARTGSANAHILH